MNLIYEKESKMKSLECVYLLILILLKEMIIFLKVSFICLFTIFRWQVADVCFSVLSPFSICLLPHRSLFPTIPYRQTLRNMSALIQLDYKLVWSHCSSPSASQTALQVACRISLRSMLAINDRRSVTQTFGVVRVSTAKLSMYRYTL